MLIYSSNLLTVTIRYSIYSTDNNVFSFNPSVIRITRTQFSGRRDSKNLHAPDAFALTGNNSLRRNYYYGAYRYVIFVLKEESIERRCTSYYRWVNGIRKNKHNDEI